jgi:uncharacterized RDD family membrane protein YckC
VRRVAHEADIDSLARDEAQRVAARVHGTLSSEPAPIRYEGLITRAIAFALDAAVIDLIALIVGVGIGLALSVIGVAGTGEQVAVAIGGVAFVVWTVAYFVVFWSTTGQTPGNRLLRIRVARAQDGHTLHPRKALLRFGALVLACVPLFAGLLPILVDPRRRGLHDMLAGTVVLGTEPS